MSIFKRLFKKKAYSIRELKTLKYFYLFLFALDLAYMAVVWSLFLISYFFIPPVEVAISLPANVWFAFVFGGLSREFFAGLLTYWCYHQFKKYSLKYKLEIEKVEAN